MFRPEKDGLPCHRVGCGQGFELRGELPSTQTGRRERVKLARDRRNGRKNERGVGFRERHAQARVLQKQPREKVVREAAGKGRRAARIPLHAGLLRGESAEESEPFG